MVLVGLICWLVSDCVQFAGGRGTGDLWKEPERSQKVEAQRRRRQLRPRVVESSTTVHTASLVTRPKIQTRSGPKGLKRWPLCPGRSSLSMWDSPFKVEQLIQVASTVLKIKMPKESERLGSHKVVKVFAISTS